MNSKYKSKNKKTNLKVLAIPRSYITNPFESTYHRLFPQTDPLNAYLMTTVITRKRKRRESVPI